MKTNKRLGLLAMFVSLGLLVPIQAWADDAPLTPDERSTGGEGVESSSREVEPVAQKILEERQAAAEQYDIKVVDGRVVSARFVGDPTELSASMQRPQLNSPKERSYLPRNHQQQQCSNWCGPATASMALNHMGVSRSQTYLARRFGISCGNGGTPLGKLHSVMNSIGSSHGFAWDLQYLPYSPTTSQKNTYVGRLYNSILGNTGSGKRYPLTGNLYIVHNGPRPPGYPNPRPGRYIGHHVEIRGFKGYGSFSQIQDPAAGIKYFENVSAHYPVNSLSLATMMGARGYQY